MSKYRGKYNKCRTCKHAIEPMMVLVRVKESCPNKWTQKGEHYSDIHRCQECDKYVEEKMSMDKCPHCGSYSGYFTKDYISGSSWYNHNFDGSEADNSQMYSATSSVRGKIAYCCNCYKKIANVEALEGEV